MNENGLKAMRKKPQNKAKQIFDLGGIENSLERGMPHSKSKSAKSKPKSQSENTMDLEELIGFM